VHAAKERVGVHWAWVARLGALGGVANMAAAPISGFESVTKSPAYGLAMSGVMGSLEPRILLSLWSHACIVWRRVGDPLTVAASVLWMRDHSLSVGRSVSLPAGALVTRWLLFTDGCPSDPVGCWLRELLSGGGPSDPLGVVHRWGPQ
jgi:hypothetical protein